MKIAFFGSPAISATILAAVNAHFPVSFVASQPDKPIGRKQLITPTPVKSFALKNNIAHTTSGKKELLNELKSITPDICLVVAYGMIIPQEILDIPRHGFINVHYSLLPKYRGASPVQWSILNGDAVTGITIMQMDKDLDHGPIISQKKVTIGENDTTGTLLEKLTKESVPLVLEILNIYSEQRIANSKEQNHDTATYTRRLTKQDGFIEYHTLKKAMNTEKLEFSDLPKLQQEVIEGNNGAMKQWSNGIIHNFIRAMSPWPAAWTLLPNGKRAKILRSAINDGKLEIKEIQIEGAQRQVDDASSITAYLTD